MAGEEEGLELIADLVEDVRSQFIDIVQTKREDTPRFGIRFAPCARLFRFFCVCPLDVVFDQHVQLTN